MANSSTYFPEGVVCIILSLLPVKSLLRFRSVCKLWLSIISDPVFIQTHLSNSKKMPSVLTKGFSVKEQNGIWRTVITLIDINSFEDSVSLSGPQNVYTTSCNGLVCLVDKYGEGIIWNPSTRQYKTTPSPKIKPHVQLEFFEGFYFDSICNDYKILRIVYRELSLEARVRVEIYSTKSDSWREIQFDEAWISFMSNLYGPSRLRCGPVIKEVLYMNSRDRLISFQLNNEMFKPVTLPNVQLAEVTTTRVLDFDDCVATVFDFDGRVALILHCKKESPSLWTLNDDDDEFATASWTKKFNFEANSNMNAGTSIYLGDGQFASKDYRDDRGIIFYDHKKKITKKFQVPYRIHVNALYSYRESLVFVKETNSEVDTKKKILFGNQTKFGKKSFFSSFFSFIPDWYFN